MNKLKLSIMIFSALMILGCMAGGCGSDKKEVKPKQEVKQEVKKEEVKQLTPEEQAKQDHDKWVKSQFSAWDGSHKELVKLVKQCLNDPKSFEHDTTTYCSDGDDLLIHMEYRANNAFGAKILQTVDARASYVDNTVTITAVNGEEVQ